MQDPPHSKHSRAKHAVVPFLLSDEAGFPRTNYDGKSFGRRKVVVRGKWRTIVCNLVMAATRDLRLPRSLIIFQLRCQNIRTLEFVV